MSGRIYHRGECKYEELSGLNYSTLKLLLKSPKHYQHAIRVGWEPGQAQKLGTLSHTAVLEPMRFLRDYALMPASWPGKTTKATRSGAQWAEFQAANAGKGIVSESEYAAAEALGTAVRSDEVAMRYLGCGHPEVTLSAEFNGIARKGRADFLCRVDGIDVIVDLKTAQDAGPHGFARDAAKYQYHVQAAWYCDLYRAITGKDCEYVIVAVEKSQPHDVVTYRVNDDVLSEGFSAVEQLMDVYNRCTSSGNWPGQGGDDVLDLQLPQWAMQSTNETECELTIGGDKIAV